MSDINLKEQDGAALPNPAAGRHLLFVDSTIGGYATKDSAGVVVPLKGPQGEPGEQGPTGATGAGLRAGGVRGQILVKESDTDYDAEWADQQIPELGDPLQVLRINAAGDALEFADESGGGGSGGIASAYDIEKGGSPTYTDLGLSDEMTSGTLNANWTVVTGTPGTADLLGAVSAATYDLATRSKGMLVQTPNTTTSLQLRAPVIADGSEIIVSFSMPITPVQTVNSYLIRLGTSQTTTAFSGTRTEMYIAGATDTNIQWFPGSGPTIGGKNATFGARQYFRMVRSGTTYHGFFSNDGTTWIPLGAHTNATAAYIWFMIGSVAAWTRTSPASGDPITAINWIRHKAYTGIDPW